MLTWNYPTAFVLFISCCSCSRECTRQFEVALHHNITVLRKRRLIVLMSMPDPRAALRLDGNSDNGTPDGSSTNVDVTHSPLVTHSIRQYLRQYTYIDRSADDWFTRLLYALPLNGMLNEDRRRSVQERTPLLAWSGTIWILVLVTRFEVFCLKTGDSEILFQYSKETR